MNKLYFLLLILTFFHIADINAQKIIPSKTKVSDVIYSQVGGKIYIKYDIIDARKNDLFDIDVKAFTDNGREIYVSSITGDIKNVSSGRNKSIIWDISEDLFEIDENIYFVLYAKLLTPKILQPVTKWEAALYSTLYPGFGTYRLTAKKYHLFKGVLGFGLVAVSGYYYKESDRFYNDYTISLNKDKRDYYYDRAISNKELSRIYAIGAGSVWLLEYVNIFLTDNKVLSENMNISYKIDNYTGAPLLSFSLNF